jgi:hypothetical protein
VGCVNASKESGVCLEPVNANLPDKMILNSPASVENKLNDLTTGAFFHAKSDCMKFHTCTRQRRKLRTKTRNFKEIASSNFSTVIVQVRVDPVLPITPNTIDECNLREAESPSGGQNFPTF